MNLKISTVTLLAFLPAMLHAQSAGSPDANRPDANRPPDLTGVWGIYRGGPGSDPKFRPPAPSPVVLKPEYDKPYQERRAKGAAAAQRGEQLDNSSARCVPYGVPTMMSIAIYPIEIIQNPKQVT